MLLSPLPSTLGITSFHISLDHLLLSTYNLTTIMKLGLLKIFSSKKKEEAKNPSDKAPAEDVDKLNLKKISVLRRSFRCVTRKKPVESEIVENKPTEDAFNRQSRGLIQGTMSEFAPNQPTPGIGERDRSKRRR
ncbi:hypothetical protein L596_008967 [Steinernema carpocapsae]|uniref:Uncharacterized protein n=1 Tax=Steinernema carpocapsae TaxID=34508 RepID=A0A4U5PE86_STECR|nr:hypothetical protein L596_008967 [Steinernema carpocapsae]